MHRHYKYKDKYNSLVWPIYFTKAAVQGQSQKFILNVPLYYILAVNWSYAYLLPIQFLLMLELNY